MVQHADLFHHPRRMVIWQHDPHDAKAKLLCSRSECGDQEIRRSGVRPAEMVLAEKYALEAKRLVTHPQIEIAREECCHIVRGRLDAWAAQLGQEFKQPGLDHYALATIVPAEPSWFSA